MYSAMRERAGVPYPVQIALPTRRERSAITALNHELREAYAAVAPAAVRIITASSAGGQIGEGKEIGSVGSGFIIDQTDSEKIVIATNRHVVDDPRLKTVGGVQEMVIQTAHVDGKQEPRNFHSGQVVYTSTGHDLAFVEIDPREHPEVNFAAVAMSGSSQRLQVPDMLMTVGSPLGVADTVNVGHVSQGHLTTLEGLDGYENYRQIDVRAIPGKSGCMVIDPSSEVPEVVGMVTMGVAGESSIGFMLPVEMIRAEYQKYRMLTRQELSVMPTDAFFSQLHSLAVQSQMQFFKHIPTRKY